MMTGFLRTLGGFQSYWLEDEEGEQMMKLED